MKVDVDAIRALAAAHLVSLVRDLETDLLLANYTERATFTRAWAEHPVLLECRGIIFASDGTVIAKPFKKFGNLGEPGFPDLATVAAWGVPEVSHKMDGSMITVYTYQDQVRFATRGSFTSTQAIAARALWSRQYGSPRILATSTYIFEYTSPTNRIVVHYPTDALTLIGLVENGQEASYAHVHREARILALPSVPTVTDRDWQRLHEFERSNFEGFVLFWPEQQVRVKVKLAAYVALHRMLSGLNEHRIWETLRDGDTLDTLRQIVPEEALPWLDSVSQTLTERFTDLQRTVVGTLAVIKAAGHDPRDREGRKAIATLILGERADLRSAFFLAIDDKDYSAVLWRLLEPQGIGSTHGLAGTREGQP